MENSSTIRKKITIRFASFFFYIVKTIKNQVYFIISKFVCIRRKLKSIRKIAGLKFGNYHGPKTDVISTSISHSLLLPEAISHGDCSDPNSENYHFLKFSEGMFLFNFLFGAIFGCRGIVGLDYARFRGVCIKDREDLIPFPRKKFSTKSSFCGCFLMSKYLLNFSFIINQFIFVRQ